MRKVNNKWVYDEPDPDYDHNDQLEMFSKSEMNTSNSINFWTGVTLGAVGMIALLFLTLWVNGLV